ncbi:bifunctional protein-serine/threonine kinase/phosphatase [Vogesella sp. LIG4]|uniref:bifunctional protein-serine/threonine kinase/phosphatase n=1 Tax=Vogesella sp. LIG4 TaxID=1192162 RepID=UPI0008202252|nr:bifunctional protein-serine/threonine kinase/phosphatase [Vogesella sp. LIG4]SCK28637.1 Serine/threonine protein phosphatase PrpC [Vogesella sp. LIG4]
MPLKLAIGQASQPGRRERNEDALGWCLPDGEQLAGKGALFALADGVSGCADGKLAASSSVRAVCADYYATPETWEVAAALDRLLGAHNRWLRSQGRSLVAALSVLVLRGRRFTVAHVGDCRVYKLGRDGLRCLTQDHVWEEPSLRHVLKRALGLDAHLVADFCDGDLAAGEVYALLCDGVWNALGDLRIDETLRLHTDPQRAAAVLVEAALAAGSQDNVSALVLRVDELPAANLDDAFSRGEALLPPPPLKPGQQFEGLTVEDRLHASPSGLAYRVCDAAGRRWVLKTLPATLAGDREAAQALLAEEWLQRRVSSPYFAEVAPQAARSHLYYLLRWYDGATLAARAGSGPLGVAEVVLTGLALCRALAALHRLGIVHRDVKPDNVHLGRDGQLRLLDLGVAWCAGISEEAATLAGTPSFLAPQLFDGAAPDAGSDLYALGVTLYWLLCGRYPYGEIEAFQRPQFGSPQPVSRHRPDVPVWLEKLLAKAVDPDAARRFETAEEFRLALERGDSQPVTARQHVPWAERLSLRLWRRLALVSLLINLLLLYVLLLQH